MSATLENLFDIVPEGEELETSTPVDEEVETETATETSEAEVTVETKEESVVETPDETGTETPEAKSDPTPDKAPDADELTQLRALLREQNRRLRELQGKVEKSTEELKEKGYIEEPTPEESAEVEQLSSTRAALLETVLETMRINPKFEDVDSVVTQHRFDDMIEGYAYAVAKQQGGSAEDYIDAVAAKVWAMPNPYRYMYENIKKYHPDFASKEEEVKPDVTAAPAPASEPRKPKPHTAPATISNLPASSETAASGWTSARIDSMPEEELGKVPKDVYQRYLSGDLK
jgi:hypothetical protein